MASIVLWIACASSGGGPGEPAARRHDEFPLDPRDDLTGPFPEGVAAGWAALAAGRNADAEREFLAARGGRPQLAAEIGLIEARVLLGRTGEALSACREALVAGTQTVPLLVACGEARARRTGLRGARALRASSRARGIPSRNPQACGRPQGSGDRDARPHGFRRRAGP